MGRPLYETSRDSDNERKVAEQIGSCTGSVMKKNPKAYPIDWCAYKSSKLTAWIEIKCRSNAKDKYPTLLLSYHKIVDGINLSATSGASFMLFVRFTDGVFYWRCPKDVTSYRVDNGGRTDRNDSQDMEPVIHIPMEEFIKLG